MSKESGNRKNSSKRKRRRKNEFKQKYLYINQIKKHNGRGSRIRGKKKSK